MEASPLSTGDDLRDFPTSLFEHFPTLIWRAGTDTRCNYFNKTWLEFTGRSLAEEVGNGWTKGIHADDFDRCVRTYLEHFAVRTPFEMEYRLRRHDGEYRWIIDAGRPIYDPDGEFAGYIGSCLDITDRRNTEAELRDREQHMRTLLSAMGEGVILRDAAGQVQSYNNAAAELLGLTPDEMDRWQTDDGRLRYFDENGDLCPHHHLPFVRALTSGKHKTGTLGIERPDGSRRWLWINAKPFFDDKSGELRGVVSTLADTTLSREHEEQRRLALTVFRNSVEAIVVTDAHERILSVNQAFTEVTGYAAEEIIGQTPRMLGSGVHSREFYQAMWRDLNILGAWKGEIEDRRKDGSLYPASLSISTVRDSNGRITHYVAVFSDITERKASEARIAYLAQHDALTGLPNRALLKDRLDQALAQATRLGKRIALMFLDLDRFKTINDSLGHATGDKLLQSVAARLRQSVRETDTVSRQGGDEFIIVLTGIDTPDEAGRIAAKILEQLDPPFDVDGQQLRTSFSIGIALFPEDGVSPETLMKNADTAMYHAKESGRDTYRFFDERMNVNTLEHLQLENGLRQAIARNEFKLAYQAQVDLASGRIIGLEALLRWSSETLGNVPPSRFIPLAEECGLIIPIGEWVLREACRQARRWQDAGLAPVPVGVNLSALQFRRSDIVAGVSAALAESGLDGRWLELELTESLLMESGPDVIVTLGQLKAVGVRLSIDDFGTGYSSLAYLKRFPVDRLKIDQSFVRDLAQDPDDAVIIRAIIQLGHNLRLEVIAEGTETLEQMDFLRREGCTAAQGYLFSRPLPAESIPALLQGGVPINR